ncbi:DNA-binding protein [Streptococcus intermedius]|uniref:SatD family protein n=1 Tax=Streptococcus intermedius TaxID=1338 RepID=UPI0006CB73AE|nr:SatD family protein [Streptococcus intermedius]ALF27684.1 DNA-binding protein [Streptococcus intermedius]AVH83520.1 DNA-binding protein [Streptococcus intermedius]
MMYIALIGDIIESKKIQDRAQVQQQLLRLMKELNWQYQDYLISPFTVTTGDEFQALFSPNSYMFQIIDQLSVAFSPYEIRFGIGVGEMVTEINKEQSIGSDGPAYWLAREAINHIHDKNDYGINHISVFLADEEVTWTVNAMLAACSFIQSKWTEVQYDVLKQLLTANIYDETFSHKEMARSLSITPSAFNKRIKASGLKIYLRNKRVAMNQILKEIAKEESRHV